MHNRLRLLQGAAALLYMGPLLAGLGGFGWAMVPVFAAIFVLWLMILRPHQWPRDLADWRAPAVWVAALGRVVSQVLLVAICFGIGRGIGGAMGFVPMFHPMLPLAMSFLSIPVSRMLWDPWKAAAMDQFLDDALHQIADPGHRPTATADGTDAAVAPLLAAPGSADPATLRPALEAVLAHPEAWQRLDALVVALDRREPNRDALRREVILWATEPDLVARGRPHSTVDAAFVTAGTDPALLRLFLPRALALIAAFPDRHDSFPSPQDVSEAITESQPDDIAQSLAALARAVEQATPPELRDPPQGRVPAALHFSRMLAQP